MITDHLGPSRWIILYTAAKALGSVHPHQAFLLPWQLVLHWTSELFVCLGKWHDGRGGNRKHNRLPDRLIPWAWPETGAEPASNQREKTRGAFFVCSVCILKIIEIVNLWSCTCVKNKINQIKGIIKLSRGGEISCKRKNLTAHVCIKSKIYMVHHRWLTRHFVFPFLMIYCSWENSNGRLWISADGSD